MVERRDLAGLVLLAAVLSGSQVTAQQGVRVTEFIPMVTVTGQGEVQAPPDTAYITVGVLTQGETAKAAVASNNEAMRRLLERLREQGVLDRNVQTSNFQISPQYHHDPRQQQQPPRIVGYQVSNQVRVKVVELDRMGSVLDAVIQEGANQIHGISFTVDNDQELLDRARRMAIDDARRKAELLAGQAGAKLGSVLEIREATVMPPPQPFAMRGAMMAADSAVPIASGEESLSVQLQVSFKLVTE